MITLTGITWITTYNCNLNCSHCFFDTQGKYCYMNPELVDLVLKEFKYGKHMFWQHLSGGEIFLDQEKLLDIISRIRIYFKKDLGISTNAFWAEDLDKTKTVVSQLAKAGVTGVALSADYYHQQQMSVKGPQNLARAIFEEDIQTHSYIMGARLAHGVTSAGEINYQTKQITLETDQGLGLPVACAVERSIGKGCAINMPKKKGIPQGKCTELNTCLGQRSPFNPAMVWIDPYGNVMICYGIIIGNVYEKSFNKIIGEYQANAFPILKELAEEGPQSLPGGTSRAQ